ncbi:Protoporphyrinogen oxidase [Xylariaceae sp. FL1272]|nr:Protoporphyrinogen oxidase [Xylariaceae sp. FL1272]
MQTSLGIQRLGLQSRRRPPFNTRSISTVLALRSRGNDSVHRIAVIGGGITGLTAAFYACKLYPRASVTLFEKSHRVGGLIESTRLRVDERNVSVCERGPRTLRCNAPRSVMTYDLIQTLGLQEEIVSVPKDSISARNRYIMYPTHLVAIPVLDLGLARRYLCTLPAPRTPSLSHVTKFIRVLISEPLFTELLSGVLGGLARSSRRCLDVEDESIGGFLARRWGSALVDNLASAIVHGLYAGDVYQLSAKTLLPGLWEADQRRRARWQWIRRCLAKNIDSNRSELRTQQRRCQALPGAINLAAVAQELEGDLLAELSNGLAGELQDRLADSSVFSFRGGLQALPATLKTTLDSCNNAQLCLNSHVTSIRNDGFNGLALLVKEQSGAIHESAYTHVIATTPQANVMSMTSMSGIYVDAVTVMLVTLCYSTPFLNHPYEGFGYLIPRGVPSHWNPEQALGVIFDSDAMPGQDYSPSNDSRNHGARQNIPPCTKITVILGGHWWSNRDPDQIPKNAEGIEMARSLLARHLDITEEPIATSVTLRPNAIPQYTVGHCERMARLHELLLRKFSGRLRVAGASYRGIGVHDSVFSARSVATMLHMNELTGLESFTTNRSPTE